MKLKQKISLRLIRAKFKVLSRISPNISARQAFTLFCTPFNKSRKGWPSIFNDSTPIYFTLNNKKVKGYQWNKDAEKKVLILHGFASAAHKFHAYISSLVKKGYGVLAFDAPAHGSSEGKTIHALEYQDMIIHIMNNYGPVTGCISHSFGGIALSLALEQIKQEHKLKVVFIAPATETVTAINDAFRMLRLDNKEVRKIFNEIILKKTGRSPEWYSMVRAVPNIYADILWIHDENDYTTPLKDVLPLQEMQLPNIRFLITKGLGHRRIYHDAEVKNEIIHFL